MRRVSTKEIDEVRSDVFTSQRVRRQLARHGAVLVDGPTGLGKSVLADTLLAEHVASDHPGLVVYLAGQSAILRERLHFPGEACGAGVVAAEVGVLLPRPRELCGPLDKPWSVMERAGAGRLAREQLCGACSQRGQCDWLGQLTKERLRDKRIVMATAAYLDVIPMLPAVLAKLTGRDIRYLIVDEATLITAPYRRILRRERLLSFLESLRSYRLAGAAAWRARWLEFLELILAGELEGLEPPPRIPERHVAGVQAAGVDTFGDKYFYLGDELRALPLREPRWMNESADLEYVRRPFLGQVKYVIMSAKLRLDVAQDRLGNPRLVRAFPDLDFVHEDTRIFNVRIRQASARNFLRNRPQLLDFAAGLIARNISMGRSTVILSRKKFIPDVVTGLQSAALMLHGATVRCVDLQHAPSKPDPAVVPVINYGVAGTNRLEAYDAVVAVNAYNLSERVLNQMLNDTRHPDDHTSAQILDRGPEGVRRAGTYVWGGDSDEDARARAYLETYEAGVVEQAIGRVRFAVRPRTIILMQCGPISYPYDQEFRSLESARTFFGVARRRTVIQSATQREVVALGALGYGTAAIARQLGVSRRTVQRARRSATRNL